MNKDKTTDSVNEGRYERLRDADIKKHGYTELAGRNDPKRAHVYKAQTRAIGRARRIAGILPGSANAQPENISNVLSRSARQSAEKRFAGKPSPRTAPKNRNRKILDSFNHGLEEGRDRNERVIGSKNASSSDRNLARTRRTLRQKVRAGDFPRSSNGIAQQNYHYNMSAKKATQKREAQIPSPRIAPKNRNRKIVAEAKKPAATKIVAPPKGLRATIRDHKPSTLVGSAIHGATVRTMDHNLAPKGRGRIRHALGGAVRGIAQHVLNSLLSSKRK